MYGESWLIAGEIGTLVENGVSNVICLQPFGCLANQVTARGVAKRMKEQYRGLNILFLDADAGMSEVNYFNRAHFFASQCRVEQSPEPRPARVARSVRAYARGLQGVRAASK